LELLRGHRLVQDPNGAMHTREPGTDIHVDKEVHRGNTAAWELWRRRTRSSAGAVHAGDVDRQTGEADRQTDIRNADRALRTGDVQVGDVSSANAGDGLRRNRHVGYASQRSIVGDMYGGT
jgi:hypothetical protein